VSPSKTRLMLFVYGTPNILGCLCALGVLGLYFGGIIERWWFVLTLGAWLFGWLLVPRRQTVPLENVSELSINDAIDMISGEFLGRLPADAARALGEIRSLIHAIGPRMNEASFPLDARIELVNTVTRDLPLTLNNYLALPPGFAHLHPVQGRKTARELLQEQLVLLFEELSDIANGVWARDADKLVSQGEYLKQKFRPVDFLAN
jgi:hypothetical protein